MLFILITAFFVVIAVVDFLGSRKNPTIDILVGLIGVVAIGWLIYANIAQLLHL